MDYLLAKRLKEAGFPQDMKSGYQIQMHTDGGNVVYVPTLLELLVWCGPEFRHLSRYEEHESETWRATAVRDGENVVFSASTPESAVAHLGLALHKVEEGGPRMPYPIH